MRKTLSFLFIFPILSVNAQITDPYPTFDSTAIGNSKWDAIFLQGAAIPTTPLKPITAPADLTIDANNCGSQATSWALAFDDGPSQYSAQTSNFMKQNNLPSTFFTIGRQISQFSDYMKAVSVDPLFEVSMHTWSHRYLFNLTNTEIIGEVVWNAKAIYDATGLVPRYLRPPYGSIDERVRAILKAMDVVPITWNVDSNDWQLDGLPPTMTQAQVIGNWTNNINAPHPNGVISLEHDFFNTTVIIGNTYLLPAVMNSKYKPTKVSACLQSQNVGGPYATSGKLYDLITGGKGSAPLPTGTIPPPKTSDGYKSVAGLLVFGIFLVYLV